MSCKPILFSTPMVQAILDGTKTMTRRVIKPQPYCPYVGTDHWYDNPRGSDTLGPVRRIPYAPGDVLWVRETFAQIRCIETGNVYTFYAANKLDYDTVMTTYQRDDNGFETDRHIPWKPSIHMPREAARLFLRVTDVWVERLQEILCGDMKREGCIPPTVTGGQYQQWQRDYWIPLWDAIAGVGYGWDKNPWVWVYSFERVDKPAGWPSGEVE